MLRVLSIIALLALSRSANAEVVRYALLVGNNQGRVGETDLQYAEQDAARLSTVLRRTGGFSAQNIAMLLGGSAKVFKARIAQLNAKAKHDIQDGRKVLLFVYFSGHADQQSLHLGRSELDLSELRSLVTDSPASFRIVVVDACKSGALTRVKGGRRVEPFSVNLQNNLETEGTALITSSASDEDSQESDDVRGSYFTHFFASGLMGAADDSGDGRVSLTEAYRYAHTQTIRATSRTWVGTQHPTFKFDTRGRGDVILTDLNLEHQDKAQLSFPIPGEYLIFKRDASGAVVADLRTDQPGRRLLLEPGQYFIRLRGADELHEGMIDLGQGAKEELKLSRLERYRYARLVRKGGGVRSLVHQPTAFYRFRGPLLSGLGSAHGAGLGYSLVLPWLTLGLRLSFTQSSASNQALRTTTRELGGTLELSRALDLGPVYLAAGAQLGAAQLTQRFDAEQALPSRNTTGFVFGALGRAGLSLGDFFVECSLEALGYLINAGNQPEQDSLRAVFTYAGTLGVGVSL